ncbi:CBS domain-containing protein [Candidatus Woesearchaeota archaeon]|nr:CBS domain-containing protein [Candidatus Woesearchaeota archaeon]
MLVKDCTLIKPLYCKKEANLVEVAKLLRQNKQRRITVIDENEFPVGIISTTDINNKVVAENKNASELKAESIMTSPIYLTCDINDKLNDIFNRMLKHESFFCPVTKEGKLYGVITYGELTSHINQKVKK